MLANLSVVNLLEIEKKPNLVTMKIPNQRVQFTIRCVSFNFEFAEWLEKDQERMRKIFTQKNPNVELIKKFLSDFESQLEELVK